MAQHNRDLAGPGIMLLSAALFGYFGFMTGMTATTASGEFVFFFALLLWTLRVGAVIFGVAAMLSMISPRTGNGLYAVGGILSAIGLVVVGVMDLMDGQRAAALPPILAFIFAVWNGYGSWTSLKEIVASRAAPQAA